MNLVNHRSGGEIGIVVAMEAELVHLLRLAEDVEEHTNEIWTYREMTIAGRRVVAMRAGMGMVNAAAGTERLIADHSPRMVLNFGCAGAHRREIMPGDVIIGDRVVHHSAMRVLRDGSERYVGFGYEVAGEKMNDAELASDATLVAAAKQLAVGHRAEAWPGDLFWPSDHERRSPSFHVGPVASADIWTQAIERLDVLHARHGSLCEDMEAAAIAQVAALHGVPFLTVKDISNNEYHAASDLDGFIDFPIAEVGKRAATFTAALIATFAELA